jgi:hypothetical protein
MPVRMEEDESSNNSSNNNRGGGGGGSSSSGGGISAMGWAAIMGIVFIAFRKWPKTTVVVLLVIGVIYIMSIWGKGSN